MVVLLSWPVPASGDVVRAETIPVGEEIIRYVGISVGVFCDDPSIVASDIQSTNTAGVITNVVVFRAEREGRTNCRVGSSFDRTSYLFAITVVPKPVQP